MKTILLTPVLIIAFEAAAQESDISENIVQELTDDGLEILAESGTSDYRVLEDLPEINLKKASKHDLESIPWLTPVQINNLLQYMIHNGSLVSKYELQAIPGWDLETVRLTAPLLKIKETSEYFDPRSLKTSLRQDGGVELLLRVRRRVQLSRGYQIKGVSGFKGAPQYWLARFRYQKKGSIDLGINVEKDAGEQFKWDPNSGIYGADHLSLYLQLENKGPFEKIIIGDFRVQWDQGMVFGSGLTFRKQVVTGPRKVHIGFIRHSGTQEYDYFRGAAIQANKRKFQLAMFYSFRKLDARLLDADSNAGLPIRSTSIIKTGLHRTPLELARKNQLKASTLGFYLRKVWKSHLVTSVSGGYQALDIPVIPNKSRHNRFAYAGRQNFNLSTAVEYSKDNINLFGQAAVGKSGGWAALVGVIGSLSHSFSVSIHLRNYQKNYHGIASRSFALTGNNINERGIYFGMQFSPGKNWIVGSYTNLFTHIYPVFTADATSSGIEQLFRTQFILNKYFNLDLYWRNRKREVNYQTTQGKATHNLADESKHVIGFRARWQSDQNIVLQTRIQYSGYSLSTNRSHGAIVAQQVSYDHKIFRFSVGMSHFDTENFENRQYLYERDLPHSLSIPFFDGTGTRWYCLYQVKPLENLDVWLKIAQTNFYDRQQVGSGNDAIDAPKRTDLSLQIRYKL